MLKTKLAPKRSLLARPSILLLTRLSLMSNPKNPENQNTFNLSVSGGSIQNLVGSGTIQYSEETESIENLSEEKESLSIDPILDPIKILFLAANSADTSRLQLGEEVRRIREGLKRADCRDRFIFEERWAVSARDLSRALLEVKPRIVHFSGHGVGTDGLAFESGLGNSQLLKTDALSELFALFSDCVECVVLNACYSQVQADEISKQIPYVIGMKNATDDKAAIEFSVGLYDALGNGKSIEFSYKFSKNTVALIDPNLKIDPVLITQKAS